MKQTREAVDRDAFGRQGLVGRAIRGRRDEVLLASKFGLIWPDGVAGGFDVRADPAYVRQACEASLGRLGVEVIDLCYLHHRGTTSVSHLRSNGAAADLILSMDDLRRLDSLGAPS